MNLTTLCYIEKNEQYLMLHRVKKQNDINKDKWIGVGGHFESQETPEECLLREVKEETGLTLTSWRFRGIVTFRTDTFSTEYMCLYTADGFEGELKECNEGNLEWVDKSRIQQLNLWEGDKVFFQLIDDDRPFFSLKLTYCGDQLEEACLDGKALELFDIRDERGRKTGVVKERSLVHRNGDLHGTAHVWIVRKKDKGGFDVLLQKRSANKDSYPGCYDISSAGHLPSGQEYLESALRELEEELGISDVKPEDLHYIGMNEEFNHEEFYGKPFRNHEISAVYVYIKPVDEKELRLQEEEVESVIWMDYDVCMSRLHDEDFVNCINEQEFRMLGKVVKQKIKIGF